MVQGLNSEVLGIEEVVRTTNRRSAKSLFDAVLEDRSHMFDGGSYKD